MQQVLHGVCLLQHLNLAKYPPSLRPSFSAFKIYAVTVLKKLGLCLIKWPFAGNYLCRLNLCGTIT